MFFFLVRMRRFEIEPERFFMLNISAILLFLILAVNPSIAFLFFLLIFRLIICTVNPSNWILLFPCFKNIINNRRCLNTTIHFALNWSSWYAVAILPCVDCGLWNLIFSRILILLLYLLSTDVWLFGIKNFAFIIALDHAVGLAHLLLNAALL